MGRGIPRTSGYGPLWCEWFGVHASASATDNTNNLNTAFSEANANGRPLFIGSGTFQINDQILMNVFQGFQFQGAGSSYLGGTIFDWQGASGGIPFRSVSMRDSSVGGFLLRSTSLSRDIAVGLQVQQGVTGTSTRNTFDDIIIHGDVVGALGCGVEMGQDVGAPNTNNDLHTFRNVQVLSYSTVGGTYPSACGYRNLQSQSKAILYEKCAFLGLSGVNAGVHGYHGHSAFTWLGGGGGYNAEEDYLIAAPNDPGTISGAYSEQSARFLGGSTSPAQIKVSGFRWSSFNVAIDRTIISWFGGLQVENCMFNTDQGPMGDALYIEANGYRKSFFEIRNVGIQTDVFPITFTIMESSYEFDGNFRVAADGAQEPIADRNLPSVSADFRISTDARVLEPSGYYRPTDPMPGMVFFDLFLKQPIWWDTTLGWITADGVVAAAAWTPNLGGTLLAAWDLDIGVTESGGIVSAVSGAYGTLPALGQATVGDRPTLIANWRNGHAAIQGTDANDFLTATLALPLAQPCVVYLLGEYGTGGVGTELCGSGNGNITVKRVANDRAAMYAGSDQPTGDATLNELRPFWGSYSFGVPDDIRTYTSVGPLGVGSGDAGAGDGDTEFRVLRGSGSGQLCKLGLILIYSAVTEAAAIEDYLNGRGAVR